VRDLLESGVAYLPREFAAERAKLEASLRDRRASPLASNDDSAGRLPRRLAMATWNLRGSSDPENTLSYLQSAHWDVVCLQEVGVVASNLLREQEGWSVTNDLELAWGGGAGSPSRPHGAAVVARNGWQLDFFEVMLDGPKPGRGVVARAFRGPEAFTVMSWHAPNRAGQGLEAKMDGYRSMIDRVQKLEGPLVIGMDANHGSPGTAIDPVDPDPDHEHALEIEFFSNAPRHHLSDALLVYLRGNPDAYRELVSQRPGGPLEVTYTHGVTPDRYDYIMISPQFEVEDIVHDYEGALAAGSDHGSVWAQLVARDSDLASCPTAL
jgi:endonuclease/exonuclease/phosphatase family metal-dependent hydrolase